MNRRCVSGAVAVAFVVSSLLVGAGVAGATSPQPAIGSKVDPCLLGTWTSTASTEQFEVGPDTYVPITGGAGGTATWTPNGLEVDGYDASTPWVGTYQGEPLVVTERGVAESWDTTSGSTLSYPGGNFVNDVTFTVTYAGQQVEQYSPPATGGSTTYSCSRTQLQYGPVSSGFHFDRTGNSVVGMASTPDGKGYWTVTSTGAVSHAGDAPAYTGLSDVDDVVAIAPDPKGTGFWVVGADGSVYSFGAAAFHGSLPGLGVHVSDIVAIAPTATGDGYWLVGADGGEFAFGDATYHGSLPGLGIHVHDIEGMVATPSGSGYLMVGADGGVFAFGATYHGSLPGLGIKVDDIVGILPTGGEAGYVLVGADGGAFVFGTGSGFYGSLPGRGIKVSDVSGIALTPDDGGYWMVRSGGSVYGFGNATVY